MYRSAYGRDTPAWRPGVLVFGCFLAGAVQAQSNPSAPNPIIEELRQQERERALRQQVEQAPDERLQRAAPPQTARLPTDEAPCFRIDQVALVGDAADRFGWVLDKLSGPDDDDGPLRRCLGTQGVNILLARAQQALIARGYVTTRVLAAPQDLASGRLTLTLVPGRISDIRYADPPAPARTLAAALPVHAGDLLDLRDIEQGLENLKRVPTADADIQIAPADSPDARPGESDLIVKYQQSRKLRASLSLDDSGTDATGRYQSGLTLALDNPLGLNDLFYVNGSHSIDKDLWSNPARGTEGQSVGYSVPWGYWSAGLNASDSRYHQSVAGYSQDYVYSGKSNNAEVSLSRLLWRDQYRKTSVAIKGWRRETRNFVDDTEIDVQHRTVGGWVMELAHKEFIGAATLEGRVAWREGTGAFGAQRVPEEFYGEGTSRMRLATADVALNLPLAWGGQQLRYVAQWRAQWNRTPLLPQDQFAIGGRYTVRGFDGESMLLAERGWLVRNDIGWSVPGAEGPSGAELYAGLDYGQVGGPSSAWLLGTSLAGGVVGVRGTWQGLAYDVFAGAPIAKPSGFRTAKVATGFNLSYSF